VRTRQAGQSALLLLDAVEILNREHVNYAVIGAFALAVLGEVRATTDADVLLHTTRTRLRELQHRFQAEGFTTDLRPGDADDPIPNLLALSDTFGNHVELLGSLHGIDPKIFSRTFDVKLRDVTLKIVGREDYIALKCFAGSAQDLLDARSVYQGAPGPIDLDLLRTVTRRFGRDAADRLEQVLAG
jgi:predicted nucleotidyltransferase